MAIPRWCLCFWFGAALNRPVLPPYVMQHLHAPMAYFPVAAALAAITGVVVQLWWGRLGEVRGARAVLIVSGIGAGTVPLLWIIVPVYWLGVPVEMIAAGCWLGHLLGLTLRAVERAEDGVPRPAALAQTHLA